jgi:hypothetical protein
MSYLHRTSSSILPILICLGLSTTASADLVSHFDSDLEGWTTTGGDLLYVATGGNSGGFLQLKDNQGGWMDASAPSKFLGDLSAYLGGSLSFDAKNINKAAADLVSAPLFGTVIISNGSISAQRTLGGTGTPPTDDAWHNYSATLDAALWSGSLANVITHVTRIQVVLESNENAGIEQNGFDNFTLHSASNPVPLPPALSLLGSGLLGLASMALRWGKARSA